MLKYLGFLLISFGLFACATPPESPADKPVAEAAASEVSGMDTVPRVGLPGQTLAPGECGIFMWSKTDATRFVFFTRGGEASALFLLNDQPTELSLTSTGGDLFEEFFTELTYMTGAGQEIRLEYVTGEPIQDGTRLPSGRIQYNDEEGWEIVLPVVGVHACQPYVEIDRN